MTDRLSSGPVLKIDLAPPSLGNNTADADRLVRAIQAGCRARGIHIPLPLLKQLPESLRKWDYRVRCVLMPDLCRWRLAGITHRDDPTPLAGMAVDLGTSRIVMRLLDLSTGATLCRDAFDNPQISVGPDVLTRIHFAEKPEGLDTLNALVIRGINRMTQKICRTSGLKTKDVYAISVSGNTTMTHLIMGLDPRWMIREPYIPAINNPEIVSARELGLDAAPFAGVRIFPSIGSYFGGDLISGILHTGMDQSDDTAILVDVGTNAEVVLGNREWLMACAGAAGPALEGGVTKMGMMAGPGAIDRVDLSDDGNLKIHSIDDMTPAGICGSGLIDLAACLFLSGRIDIRGRLVPEKCGDHLKKIDDILHFVLVPGTKSATGKDLTLSQVDLDSLIRSKAAMYTILETITGSVGMSLSELSVFHAAGTFGSFIRPASAIAIGMLPDLPMEKYRTAGNTSLEGAAKILLDPEAIERVESIRNRITYMELNVNQDFMNRFSAAKFIPHTNPDLFPSLKKKIRIKASI